MRFLTLVLFFLIQLNASAQFYGPLKPSPSAGYTSDFRYAHGENFKRLKFVLEQVSKLTDSKISYEYEGLKFYTTQSERVNVDQNGKRKVERTTYKDSACRYMKAVFTGGLNATYEAWFNPYHVSKSIRIVFDTKDQYLSQIEEIESSKHYLRLSTDSLVLTSGKFSKKSSHQKLFGEEFMTLDPENLEINVVARYYNRKEYKALEQKILAKKMAARAYKVSFYPDSVKINNELVQLDTSFLTLSPNGTSRFVFWENEENKLSILLELNDSPERLKIKSRVEEFHKGKWRKPKLKMRYYREIIPAGFTHWNSIGEIYHHPSVKETRTGSRVIRFFEDEDGNSIEVNGYLEFTWVNS